MDYHLSGKPILQPHESLPYSQSSAQTLKPEFRPAFAWFEVALHATHSHCNTIDERERLRVFRKHGRQHTCSNVSTMAQISLFRALASLRESLRSNRQ